MLRFILESEHAAVIAPDAYLELDPGGEKAVQAMVKANLLSYRPPSGVCMVCGGFLSQCLPQSA